MSKRFIRNFGLLGLLPLLVVDPPTNAGEHAPGLPDPNDPFILRLNELIDEWCHADAACLLFSSAKKIKREGSLAGDTSAGPCAQVFGGDNPTQYQSNSFDLAGETALTECGGLLDVKPSIVAVATGQNNYSTGASGMHATGRVTGFACGSTLLAQAKFTADEIGAAQLIQPCPIPAGIGGGCASTSVQPGVGLEIPFTVIAWCKVTVGDQILLSGCGDNAVYMKWAVINTDTNTIVKKAEVYYDTPGESTTPWDGSTFSIDPGHYVLKFGFLGTANNHVETSCEETNVLYDCKIKMDGGVFLIFKKQSIFR